MKSKIVPFESRPSFVAMSSHLQYKSPVPTAAGTGMGDGYGGAILRLQGVSSV